MYGGSHKFNRGGGRGGASKRNSFPPPPAPPHRIPSSTASGRLSLSGGVRRGRNPSPSSAIPPPSTAADESFSLVAGEPLSFAAIIRLAPDLVEEIKRVEALGGAARIKFDPNPNNSLGNVIDVGGKEFRFTWSHEMGGLCDIYEERRSGEDGNGLLVESGCAWRKLNVQRVLDESTKNHVKKRSEEAERKLKSRRAIVLDQCNPTVKSQVKALAAAEASPWKFKHKNDLQFKKRNFEPSQVGASHKTVNKPGSSSTSTVKGRLASPLLSPHHHSSASPSVRGRVSESQATTEDMVSISVRAKENTFCSENDFAARAPGRTLEAASQQDNQVTLDMRKSIVTLLKENPKGMSLKALEKAVGDVAPSSARQIDPILKKIATYEAPGKYTLKPGVELDSFKFSDSGSSPEDDQQKHYVPEENSGLAPDSGFVGKSPAYDMEEQIPMNVNFEEEPNLVGKDDASQCISNLFGDDDPTDNSEGRAASSSDSGSDSDSDSGSSDRSSNSGSRSRSRSPEGTASGSGSDSENDSSSNSKEGSDMDVNILDDDDKEPKNLHDDEHVLSTKPVPWSLPEARPVEVGGFGNQDGYTSEDVDIEKDLDYNEGELAIGSHDPTVSTGNLKTASPDRYHRELYGVEDMHDQQEDVADKFKLEHPDTDISKGKSKRGSNMVQSPEYAESVKRLKTGSVVQPSMPDFLGSSPLRSSPDITNEDFREKSNLQMQNKFVKDKNSYPSMNRVYNCPPLGKSDAELLQSAKRLIRDHGIDKADKSVKPTQNLGQDVKYQETNSHGREGLLKQGDQGHKGTLDEEGVSSNKVNGKFKEGSLYEKQLGFPDRHHKKHSEEGKRSNRMENSSRLHMGSPPKDKAFHDSLPVDKKRLQRELSDLELGELREPLTEEHQMVGKQFERVGSFKHSENKGATGSRNEDLKGKIGGKEAVDLGDESPPYLRTGNTLNSNNWPKRRSPEPVTGETMQSADTAMKSQQQPFRGAHSEVGSLSDKAVDLSKSRQGVSDQGTDFEGYGETQKKSQNGVQLEDSRQHPGSRKVKGNKSRKSSTLEDATDRRKDVSVIDGSKDKHKRNGSSSNEDSSYSKYEKENPELKGPIKNFSEYKEYVQEFREKYDSYCSLHKNLERYRNDFQKLGMDLESAKGRDMERYHSILAQIKESYQQCGTRHTRLKKIFLVLHEELKHLKQMIKDFAVDYMRD